MSAALPLVRSKRTPWTPYASLTEVQAKALADLRARLESGSLRLEEAPCLTGALPAEAILVSDIDRYGVPIGVHLDPKSGLMWTSPRLSEASIEPFYRDLYRALYRGRPKADPKFYQTQIGRGRQVLGAVSGHVSTGRVFDIGCGAGGSLIAFREAGWECAGCDFGADYLEEGRKAGLELRQGNASSLSDLGPAQLAFALHVLEHTLDPVGQIAAWRDLLAEGGHLYLEVPGVLHAYADYGTFEKFVHLAHTYHFTLATLRGTVEPVGFEFVDGGEGVWALFKKSAPRPCNWRPGEAEKIVRYLKLNESSLGTLARKLKRPLSKLARRREKKGLGGS
ncbi:MAG: methyltransferase domain-containing protein [Armatimonadetes bacterium]|nr:methyltransferase domain-containing protein [Armatimonadota bacterium]